MAKDHTLYLHRILFKNKVYTARAQAWEDFFGDVMFKRYPDFEVIKAHNGDGGNDGYRSTQGVYYACYGPEEERKEATLTFARKKALDDFNKLLREWHSQIPIRRYHPVFNDRYWGISAEMSQLMIKIKDDNSLDDASFLLPKHLEEIFIALPEVDRDDLIGFSPDPDRISSQIMDYEVMGEVINHILENRKPITLSSTLATPEFDDKIKFNSLCLMWANCLQSGSYHIGTIDDFFRNNSNFDRQKLRNAMAQYYKDAVDEISHEGLDSQGINKNDLVFYRILDAATPNKKHWSSGKVTILQEVVLVVMAYYFEACDIFEPPPALPVII